MMVTRALVTLLSCFSPLWAMAGEILVGELSPIISDENRTVQSLDGVYPSTLPVVPAQDEQNPNQDTRANTNNRIVCRGTSPFWTLVIDQRQMIFEQSGSGSKAYSVPAVTPSLNSAQSVTAFQGSSADGSALNAIITDAKLHGVMCSDNMSEQPYGYSVFITHGSQLFNGCCWLEQGTLVTR